MQPALLTRRTNEAVLRNHNNPQVFLEKEGAQLHAEPFFLGVSLVQCFYSRRVWDCVSLRGVFHYRAPRETNPPLVLHEEAFFCGLGMGEKQQSLPVSHSSSALIVSTFLQRRGVWRGGRNAHSTRVCNEWQSPLGLKENCSGLCLRMHNEDWFAGLPTLNKQRRHQSTHHWCSSG